MTATQNEIWPNGIASIEWNSIFHSTVLQVHVGDFFERGYYVPTEPTNMVQYYDVGLNELYGNPGTTYSRHNRWQANGELSYRKTGWGGTHNFKFVGGN